MNSKIWITTTALFLTFVPMSYADIIVGVGAPLTGGSAAIGEQIRRGAQQAADDLNAKGGIGGEKIELSFGDDASDPKQGVSVANKFVGDDVKFVIGHFNSGVSIPTAAVYAENGVLQITPGSTNPKFTDQGLWNTIRVCGRDDQQGSVAAKYILKNFSGAPVAILNDKTAYGAGIATEVAKTLNGAGLKEVMNESINVGDKDFSTLIDKLNAAGVRVVYFGGVYGEGALLVRQAAERGLKAVFVGGDGIASSEFGQITGESGVGTLMTFAPDPRRNPNAKDTVAAFRAAGFEPEAYTLYAYASLQLIKAAIEAGGSDDPEAVAETLKSGREFTTVLGPLSFDGKGDRKDDDFVMYEWRLDASKKLDYQMMQ